MKSFTNRGAVKRIAESSVRRLAIYLRHLEELEHQGRATVSSEELAGRAGTTSAQMRKDLSFFGSFGKRGLGYAVPELSRRLRSILGVGREWRVIIVGAGKIGSALAQYRGFRQHGFTLVGIYDTDPARLGQVWNGVRVRDMECFERDFRALRPQIAVVTVPAEAAQSVVDRLAKAGIRGILNFAPIGLHTRGDVTIRSVNMAVELEMLSYALSRDDTSAAKGRRSPRRRHASSDAY